MPKKGDSGGVESMNAMWKDMRERTKAKARSTRSRSHPISLDHVVWSTTSNSSSFDSNHSSSAASAFTNSSADVCTEGKAQSPRKGAAAAMPATTASSGSSSAVDWVQGEGPGCAYAVPHGFVIRNTFLELPDVPEDCQPEPAVARQNPTPAPQSAPAPQDVHPVSITPSRLAAIDQDTTEIDALGTSLSELSVSDSAIGVPSASGIAGGPVAQEAGACSSQPAEAAPQQKKSRPRPPKPKRVQGKFLAEMYFKAQLASDEARELAEQHFLKETSADPQLYDYAHSVLRCLNSEARDREACGEDPLLTTVHL